MSMESAVESACCVAAVCEYVSPDSDDVDPMSVCASSGTSYALFSASYVCFYGYTWATHTTQPSA